MHTEGTYKPMGAHGFGTYGYIETFSNSVLSLLQIVYVYDKL